MLKLLWAWATVSFSTHPECLKAPFTSIWSFETFTSSEFSQLMLQQLRQVYTKSCNCKTANNLDYVQTSRCVHIHYVQTRHCVHIVYVQTSTFLWKCHKGFIVPKVSKSFSKKCSKKCSSKRCSKKSSKKYSNKNICSKKCSNHHNRLLRVL